MKKVFELSINGKFSQHIMVSETRLLSTLWEDGKTITLKCVFVTKERYKFLFGK